MKYSIKWEIKISNEYKERLLNLMAQGYLSESWIIIYKHIHVGTEIFNKEIRDIQMDFIVNNLEVIL